MNDRRDDARPQAELVQQLHRLRDERDMARADAARSQRDLYDAHRALAAACRRLAAGDQEGARQLLCDMNARANAAALPTEADVERLQAELHATDLARLRAEQTVTDLRAALAAAIVAVRHQAGDALEADAP
jgi:hypothetical protein